MMTKEEFEDARRLWVEDEPPTIDWEQRRYEIAKEMLTIMVEQSQTFKLKKSEVGYCVNLADKLIELLQK